MEDPPPAVFGHGSSPAGLVDHGEGTQGQADGRRPVERVTAECTGRSVRQREVAGRGAGRRAGRGRRGIKMGARVGRRGQGSGSGGFLTP